ncbi:hypothetical protein FHETE_5059 [Fusarium heterosporum]|uniref:Uncharacterized protein n=1 Tax=Fusarium heterosporum TaxID=42747 RepID=A0A8H5WRB1_FUSHE|nr:hypothetical protein FHETE_5059 [Fusarium heterosporum]
MTHTTGLPSWLWLPLRDGCEWDSIFIIHKCFDDNYNNIVLALIRVLLEIFMAIPLNFWLFMAFHYRRYLASLPLLVILSILGFPVWFFATIFWDDYERQRDAVEASFYIMRKIWLFLALPNFVFYSSNIKLRLRQGIVKMQEAIVSVSDYVHNIFDFEINFPETEDRDVLALDSQDTGAERWVKKLIKEAKIKRQAMRDEEARVQEQKDRAKQVALFEKQQIDRMLDVTSKALSLRRYRPDSRRAHYDPSTPSDRKLLVEWLKLERKRRTYVNSSTQTYEVDFAAYKLPMKPLGSTPRGYVSHGVQTELVKPPTYEESKVVDIECIADPTVDPVSSECWEVMPELAKVVPEAREETIEIVEDTSQPIDKGKGLADPESTINSNMTIIYGAPAMTSIPVSSLTRYPAPTPAPASVDNSANNGPSTTLLFCLPPPQSEPATAAVHPTVITVTPTTTVLTPTNPVRPSIRILNKHGRGSRLKSPLKTSKPAKSGLGRHDPMVRLGRSVKLSSTIYADKWANAIGLNSSEPSPESLPSEPVSIQYHGTTESTEITSVVSQEVPQSSGHVDLLPDISTLPIQEEPFTSFNAYGYFLPVATRFETPTNMDTALGNVIGDSIDQSAKGSEPVEHLHEDRHIGDGDLPDHEMLESELPQVPHDQTIDLHDSDEEMADHDSEKIEDDGQMRIQDIAMGDEQVWHPNDEEEGRIKAASMEVFMELLDDEGDESCKESETEPVSTDDVCRMRDRSLSPSRPSIVPQPQSQQHVQTTSSGYQPQVLDTPKPEQPTTGPLNIAFPPYNFARPIQTPIAPLGSQPTLNFTQNLSSEQHGMSQSEQDGFARWVEESFETEGEGIDAQTAQNLQPLSTNTQPSIHIDSNLEAQTPIDSGDTRPSPEPNALDIYSENYDHAIRTSYKPDPPKVASQEQLASRRIARPRTARSGLTSVRFPHSLPKGESLRQHQTPQQQQPKQSQDTQVSDIGVMVTPALDTPELARMADIPIPTSSDVQTQIVSPKAKETTTQQATVRQTNNEEITTSAPVLTEKSSQSAPIQQQHQDHATNSAAAAVDPSNVPQQATVAPIQMGVLLLPGGNALMSNPTAPVSQSPLTPLTPLIPQSATKHPLSKEDKVKRDRKQIEKARKAREAKKKAGPSLFHKPKGGSTSGPSKPITPRQNPPGFQPGSVDAEEKGLTILEVADIPKHLQEQVREDKD